MIYNKIILHSYKISKIIENWKLSESISQQIYILLSLLLFFMLPIGD